MQKSTGNADGFSIIELMIVVGILSIIVFFVPNFVQILEFQRLKGCARDLYSRLQKAKVEAVRQNANVVVDFTTAVFTPAGRAGSYRVFIDNGAGGGTANNFVRDGNEPTLTTVTMPRNVTLVSTAFTGGASAVGFNNRGLPANSRIGNVQVRTESRWYRITLSIAGNMRMDISRDGVNW